MMIRAGIIGGSGYTGGELIRLLQNHPQVTVDFVYSTTKAGKKISGTHTDLLGTLDLTFTDSVNRKLISFSFVWAMEIPKAFYTTILFLPKQELLI